jgi:hypothetical protein
MNEGRCSKTAWKCEGTGQVISSTAKTRCRKQQPVQAGTNYSMKRKLNMHLFSGVSVCK